MKKALKILGITIVIILIALVAIPYFYKDEINAFIKEDINKNFNAIIDYNDVSLSLLKDFPNLHIRIDEITIDGIGDFQDIELAYLKRFELSLDAKKVFLDKEYEITKLKIDALNLNLLVLKNGKANYDIVKENPNDSIATSDKSFELKLKEYELTNSNLSYKDQGSGMNISLQDINHFGNGAITDKSYLLKTKTDIQTGTFDYGIKYINKATMNLVSDILIENEYSKYTFENSNLLINQLEVAITKSIIELKEDDILLDIELKTKENELKQLLSLIPKEYLTDLADVTTNGTANLSGFVKGVYNDNNYPAYEFNLKVVNGYLKYPDLPESLKDINLISKVVFAGGKNLDNTLIDLSKIHFSVAQNNVDGSLRINNPMSDPLLKTAFKSKIDLGKLKQAIKTPYINKLNGLLDADIKLKGRMSAIENNKYDKFDASGFFNLADFQFKTDSIPYDIAISKASMDITPTALKLKNLDATIGKNDFKIKGDVTNYIAYMLNKDEILKADFTMQSNFINLNDFITDDATEKTDSTGIIKIPKNVDLNFKADVTNLRYSDLDFKDTKGTLSIKDEKAHLEAMLLKTLEGQMVLSGEYDSANKTPKSSFDIKMKKMSIIQSANSFSTFQAFAPILQKIQGDFFSNFKIDVSLDNEMNPILNTVKAQGDFNTSNIKLKGIDIISSIGNILKINALHNAKIDKVKAKFSIDKGTMTVKPFNFKLNNIESSLQGSFNLNKKLNLVLSMDIPREMLGANPNAFLESIVGKLSDLGLKTDLGDIIKMKFRITGDYKNPKILPAIDGYEGSTTTEIIEEVIEDKIEEVVDEAVEKARAEAKKQAAKIMEFAQTQADSIMFTARKLAVKVNELANTQSDSLISKATTPFEKLSAVAATNLIKSEAKKESNKLVGLAQSKADLILQNAQTRADKLIETPVEIKKDSIE